MKTLTDSDPMPFGKYHNQNRTMGEVPLTYWRWLLEQDWASKWPAVRAYAVDRVNDGARPLAPLKPAVSAPMEKQEAIRQPSNTWVCPACGNKEIDNKDFKAHLVDVHHVEKFEGMRTAIVHADGKDFFLWQFRWNISGHTFFQTVVERRR